MITTKRKKIGSDQKKKRKKIGPEKKIQRGRVPINKSRCTMSRAGCTIITLNQHIKNNFITNANSILKGAHKWKILSSFECDAKHKFVHTSPFHSRIYFSLNEVLSPWKASSA